VAYFDVKLIVHRWDLLTFLASRDKLRTGLALVIIVDVDELSAPLIITFALTVLLIVTPNSLPTSLTFSAFIGTVVKCRDISIAAITSIRN